MNLEPYLLSNMTRNRPFLVEFCLFLAAAVLLLCATGCTQAAAVQDAKQIVVQAYLFAGEPVRDVFVGTSFAVGSTDSTNIPVSTATVTLTQNAGKQFILTPTAGKAGYYSFAGEALEVRSGDVFRIDVRVGDASVYATTTVPSKPDSVGLSRASITLQVNTISTPRGSFTQLITSDSVVAMWPNDAKEYYYTVTTSIDPARVQLRTDSLRFQCLSEPTTESRQRIATPELRYTGLHSVKVYHVNKEYADLYKSRAQDSRTLSEPLTNIKGGLGVFSAFASDSAVFTVRKQ